MDIVQQSQALLLRLGAGWVLWILVAASLVSIAVVIERLVALRPLARSGTALRERLRLALRNGGRSEAQRTLSGVSHPAARVAARGIEARAAHDARHAMDAEMIAQRRVLEKRFAFLATLGANAPFVGLLGTVIGILEAFHALGEAASKGSKAALDPSHVMTGVGEALVATAVGLAVAIPAIIAFNMLQRLVRSAMDDAQSASLDVIAHLESERA